MKASHTIRPVFDDPNLVGCAGLVPALLLARAAGLDDLATEHLGVEAAHAAAKTTAIVAGMLAGADSIDDLDVLRHGAMPTLFSGVVAPSTIGTYLRTFTAGQIAQLDAVASRFLLALVGLVGGLLAGATATTAKDEGIVFIDVDDTIRQVYGHAKQGAAYGYSKVKGLNAQLAILSTPLAAPMIAAAKLRRGNVASASGSARLLARARSSTPAGASCCDCCSKTTLTCERCGRADSRFLRLTGRVGLIAAVRPPVLEPCPTSTRSSRVCDARMRDSVSSSS